MTGDRSDVDSKLGVLAYLRRSHALNALTLPLIYSLAVPLVLLDCWVTIYQSVCFPLYGIARTPRAPFLVFDRHKLPYLNAIEKAHCAYCSYATGVLGYARDVAARTERFWCPIKHATRVPALATHQQGYFEYGDAASYRRDLERFRRALRRRQPIVLPMRRAS